MVLMKHMNLFYTNTFAKAAADNRTIDISSGSGTYKGFDIPSCGDDDDVPIQPKVVVSW